MEKDNHNKENLREVIEYLVSIPEIDAYKYCITLRDETGEVCSTDSGIRYLSPQNQKNFLRQNSLVTA